MRFFCEWCHEQVQITNKHTPYPEVLSHFSSCKRRSPLTTPEQVTGLAKHITNLIVGDQKRMRQAG